MCLSAAELKEGWLRGVPLADAQGRLLAEEVLEQKIRSAVASVERETGVLLARRLVYTRPDLVPPATEGYTEALAEPPYDLPADAYSGERWGGFKVRRLPVKQVLALRYQIPGMTQGFNVPPEWLQVDPYTGFIRVVPYGSTIQASWLDFQGSLLATVSAGMRALPHSVQVAYYAGLDEFDLRGRYADLLEAVGLQAAVLALASLQVGRNPGVASESVGQDGLSHSKSYASRKGPYGDLIDQYQERLREILEGYRHGEAVGVLWLG